MDDINTLPKENSPQEIEITPQEVLDYFTNNTKANAQKLNQKVVSANGDVELKISHEEWKASGLDDSELNKTLESLDPAVTAPVPEISDITMSNAYTQELLQSSVTTEAQVKLLYDLSKVTITDSEKEHYLRSVLNNEQLELYVTVGNKHKIGFNCVSKTIEIQNLITTLANIYINERDENDNTKYKHNTYESGLYLLKLNAMFCLQGEGDTDCKKPSMFIPIPLDISFERQQELVQQNIAIIDKLPFAKWNAMLNIMRIFEQKEVLLGAELISGDF